MTPILRGWICPSILFKYVLAEKKEDENDRFRQFLKNGAGRNRPASSGGSGRGDQATRRSPAIIACGRRANMTIMTIRTILVELSHEHPNLDCGRSKS
jgi:hypothetical protein